MPIKSCFKRDRRILFWFLFLINEVQYKRNWQQLYWEEIQKHKIICNSFSTNSWETCYAKEQHLERNGAPIPLFAFFALFLHWTVICHVTLNKIHTDLCCYWDTASLYVCLNYFGSFWVVFLIPQVIPPCLWNAEGTPMYPCKNTLIWKHAINMLHSAKSNRLEYDF